VNGRVQRGTAALLAVCCLSCTTAAQAQPPRTLDALTASCPSRAEIARLNKQLRISFEHDPSRARRCGMTLLRERAYQALRVMQSLRFDVPLPWTRQTLWGWFTNAVRGVRFRGDIDTSYCCAPPQTLNIEAQYMDALTGRARGWLDAHGDNSLAALVVDLVHEARHAEGPRHTCRAVDDATLEERGAWGAEISLELWLGLHSTSFFDAPGARERYRDAALRNAQADMDHVCALPVADVSLRLDGATAVVVNNGGVTLARAWLATESGNRALARVAPGIERRVTFARAPRWLRVVATASDPRPANNVVHAR
jgi:hypothetical protein